MLLCDQSLWAQDIAWRGRQGRFCCSGSASSDVVGAGGPPVRPKTTRVCPGQAFRARAGARAPVAVFISTHVEQK